ncbi:hypothetical protein EDC01DRAFT_632358 [Geopyxis carbonaria]|nr:hypothetical protein EDC01DRAFT_632358 [Geopyxis carbonaria]
MTGTTSHPGLSHPSTHFIVLKHLSYVVLSSAVDRGLGLERRLIFTSAGRRSKFYMLYARKIRLRRAVRSTAEIHACSGRDSDLISLLNVLYLRRVANRCGTGRGTTTTKRSKKRPRGARRTTSTTNKSPAALNAAATPSNVCLDLSGPPSPPSSNSTPTTASTTTSSSTARLPTRLRTACTSQKNTTTIPKEPSPPKARTTKSKKISKPQDAPKPTPTSQKAAMGGMASSDGGRVERTKTLVNGEYIEHSGSPDALPEPLFSGFKTWVLSQKTPQPPLTARWNNRLLQYWRLATDTERFKTDSTAEDNNNDEGKAVPLYQQPAPAQRPYTAPAHQLDRGR